MCKILRIYLGMLSWDCNVNLKRSQAGSHNFEDRLGYLVDPISKLKQSQVWWYTSLISVLRRRRQVDLCFKFQHGQAKE